MLNLLNFEAEWKKENGLNPFYDFGGTNDLRQGRVIEIDLCYWADVIDALTDECIRFGNNLNGTHSNADSDYESLIAHEKETGEVL